MMRRIRRSTRGLLAASLLGSTFGLVSPATAATIQYTNVAAPSFVGKETSLHNDGVAPDACAEQVALEIGQENRGDLQNAKGSFIANVILPQGSFVTKVTLFANDADSDLDSSAYLMRKRIANGLSPAKSILVGMAHAETSGAVTDTMRAFSDTTIENPKVANGENQYFIELVNCGTTVEPFSVQIVTSTP